MRSKTVKQVRKQGLRLKRWRDQFPWFLTGPHGFQGRVCRDAQVESVWARGESNLSKIRVIHSNVKSIDWLICWLVDWPTPNPITKQGCRGVKYIFASHLRQHAECETHRIAVPCLHSSAFHTAAGCQYLQCNSQLYRWPSGFEAEWAGWLWF